MKYRLILVVAMFAILMTGCQFNQVKGIQEFTERQPLNLQNIEVDETFILDNITIVGLGDSLTQGVGDERNLEGYIGRLGNEMTTFKGVRDVSIMNEAKRGQRSDQLLSQLHSGKLDSTIQKADFVFMTIGGNDIMRIIKQDLFHLRVDAFQKELIEFTQRFNDILEEIRRLNPDSPIILLGLYNPFSVVTDEANEFDQILRNWNQVINILSNSDNNACFVPVDDLFNSNANMVYHTDFFHPNSQGYEQMTSRILDTFKTCGLKQLTNGELDF